MRLHPAVSFFGLLVWFYGFQVPSVSVVTAAFAAGDCRCGKTASGACIPDQECEAAERIGAEQRNGRPYHGGARSNHFEYNASAPKSGARAGAGFARPTLAPPPPSSSDIAAPAASTATGPQLHILDTGWAQLVKLGRETRGFGLYSYVILPANSPRAVRFLAQVFTDVPSIDALPAPPAQLNVLYVPLRQDKEADFATLIGASHHKPDKMSTDYAATLYDYRMAKALLYKICNRPHDSVRDLCAGDLSRGPYLFTYAAPATELDTVPPPYLFVDLSTVPEQGFGELLVAFREQIKRDDISDRARIDTLRLKVLEYLLRASIVIDPMEKAVGDIIRAAMGGDGKK